jgi:hypothetical protein
LSYHLLNLLNLFDFLEIGGQLVEPTRTSMPAAGSSRIR